jgi:hypothetical protein
VCRPEAAGRTESERENRRDRAVANVKRRAALAADTGRRPFDPALDEPTSGETEFTGGHGLDRAQAVTGDGVVAGPLSYVGDLAARQDQRPVLPEIVSRIEQAGTRHGVFIATVAHAG